MPDYPTIGMDNDFCRVAMAPITAQKLADLFGATLPTAKLVDDINLELVIDNRLPVTDYPSSHISPVFPAHFIQQPGNLTKGY